MSYREDKMNKAKIGVVGLGMMGRSICACLLASGHTVQGIDKDEQLQDEVVSTIREFLTSMKNEGNSLTVSIESSLGRFSISTDFETLEGSALVIETIVEDVEAKRNVFASIESVVEPSTIIGSNTSAIPITMLQQGTQHPERFVGLHWAEPAHTLRFLEVICGNQTDPDHADKVAAWAKNWRKSPSILKKDIRGFICNRIWYAILREAFHLVESGVCEIQDVDRSIRNDLGYWIGLTGVFRYLDLTGLPAYRTVCKDLFKELCTSTEVPKLLDRVVSEGGQGTANAQGLYPYTAESAKRWNDAFHHFTNEMMNLTERYQAFIEDSETTKTAEKEDLA